MSPWEALMGQRYLNLLVYLSKLVHLFQDSSHGLYQDDGLGVLRDFSGPETERF